MGPSYGGATMEPVDLMGTKPPAPEQSKAERDAKPGWQQAQEEFDRMLRDDNYGRGGPSKQEGPQIPEFVKCEKRGETTNEARGRAVPGARRGGPFRVARL